MSKDKTWSKVKKTDRDLALATPEARRRILRKRVRATLRGLMTMRQVFAMPYERHGWPKNARYEETMADYNRMIGQCMANLEFLGLPEPGEDRSRWRLHGG